MAAHGQDDVKERRQESKVAEGQGQQVLLLPSCCLLHNQAFHLWVLNSSGKT